MYTEALPVPLEFPNMHVMFTLSFPGVYTNELSVAPVWSTSSTYHVMNVGTEAGLLLVKVIVQSFVSSS